MLWFALISLLLSRMALLELQFDTLVIRIWSFFLAMNWWQASLTHLLEFMKHCPQWKYILRTHVCNIHASLRMQKKSNHFLASTSFGCLHTTLSPTPQSSGWDLNGILHCLLHFISLTLLVFPLCPPVLAPSLSPLTSFPLIPSSLSHFTFCLSVSLFPPNKPHTPKWRRN